MTNQTANDSGIGRFFAGAGKVIVALTVLAFLGMHTLNFFAWTFPDEQAIYRPLGFGLTGGAFIAYILIFKFLAKTDLQKFVSMSMILICGIGELAAAGFGMQVEAYTNAGITFTKEEIDIMIWAIRILGGVHAVALVLDFIGDDIGTAWKSKGTPISETVFDRRAEARTYPAQTARPGLWVPEDEYQELAKKYPSVPGTFTPTVPHYSPRTEGEREVTTPPSPFPTPSE